jgi:hypothetical protein
MASAIPLSFFNDVFKGNIDMDTDTFKRLLITAVPAVETFKDSWAKRSDVTNEHGATGNYATGGTSMTVTVPAIDTTNNRQEITLGSSTWASSTITAAGSVIYKSRGGAATADELVFLNDFGGNVSTTNGTFTANADTIRIAN